MYDIIVIGGGPGGYVAAERAGARGKKVLLIEKAELGGTCLNVGCIPTKTLLNAAKLYRHAKESSGIGVRVENASFDMLEATKWKEDVISRLRSGVDFLMKKNAVEIAAGEAELVDRNTVRLKDSGKEFQGSSIIIATGSRSALPPIPGAVIGEQILDSTGLLSIKENPRRLSVIGGGVIGMEFASLFRSLGSEVTVIEMLDEIVPLMDSQLAPVLRRALKGIDFNLGAKVERIEGTTVTFTREGKTASIDADLVLLAVGRKPNVEGIGVERLGIDVAKRGIVVDDRMQTNVPGVFAVGDVTGMSLLAHSASRMGEVAVDAICGGNDRMRYDAIPWVVYTDPEASGCGLTEDEAKRRGIECRTAAVPLRSNGRFLAENGPQGIGSCKVIVDAKSDVILGIHIVGGTNSEMIFGASAFIENEMRSKDVRQMVFPHPSVSESIRDALWELAP